MVKFIFLTMLVIALMVVPTVSSADSVSIDDTAGNTIVDSLKSFSKSGWGKALFFASLLVGVLCILSGKHRTFGIIALVFGILLGAYSGLGDSLWGIFSGLSE
jgi:formate-dependent nitrite reductase membrane component NrfD